MGQDSKISTLLGADAFCLLTYPGIFSGLSNDGKQGTVSNFYSSTIADRSRRFRVEPTLFIPGNFYYWGLNLPLPINPVVV